MRKLEDQFKDGEVDLARLITGRASFFSACRTALDTLIELAQASITLFADVGLPPSRCLRPGK